MRPHVIGALIVGGLLLLCVCPGGLLLVLRMNHRAVPAPPPVETSGIPRPNSAIEMPLYNGSLEDLVPEQVGRFKRTESRSAFNLGESQETWSAFYHSDEGHEIHLRILRFASPQKAHAGMLWERGAAVTTQITRTEPVKRDGRLAGTLAVGRYRNLVKNIDAEAVWCTKGNLALVAGSKDGLFAEEFWNEYDNLVPY